MGKGDGMGSGVLPVTRVCRPTPRETHTYCYVPYCKTADDCNASYGERTPVVYCPFFRPTNLKMYEGHLLDFCGLPRFCQNFRVAPAKYEHKSWTHPSKPIMVRPKLFGVGHGYNIWYCLRHNERYEGKSATQWQNAEEKSRGWWFLCDGCGVWKLDDHFERDRAFGSFRRSNLCKACEDWFVCNFCGKELPAVSLSPLPAGVTSCITCATQFDEYEPTLRALFAGRRPQDGDSPK